MSVLVEVRGNIYPQFHHSLRGRQKKFQRKYSQGFYIMRLFITSTFFLLHVSHTNCMIFNVSSGWVLGEYLPPISSFTERETRNSSKINILMDSISWDYLQLLHSFRWMFNIQIAWFLIFQVVEVRGSIYPKFLYSLKGRQRKVPNK